MNIFFSCVFQGKTFLALFFISNAFFFCFSAFANTKPILNILSPIETLDPNLIDQFEKENNVTIRTEFTATHYEYEGRLRSDVRSYDVVLGMERELVDLANLKLLNSTNINNDNISDKGQFPLAKVSKYSETARSYVTLSADPIGLVYIANTFNQKGEVSWDLLINPNKNPYWRQRIFVPKNNIRLQIFLALLATDEKIVENAQSLPASAFNWIKALKRQNVESEMPLYSLFISSKIYAATAYLSQYNAMKKIIRNLEFRIPKKGTYYDRLAVGIPVNANEVVLARKFIRFLSKNSATISSIKGLIDVKTKETVFAESALANWILYDENFVIPRKIQFDVQKLIME